MHGPITAVMLGALVLQGVTPGPRLFLDNQELVLFIFLILLIANLCVFFGGWLMSQMDIAGGVLASQIAEGRVATIAVDGMTFHRPVYVGDAVCVYGDIERIGNTSMVLHLESWVLRKNQPPRIKVTEATFTFVAIDAEGRPRPVRKDGVVVLGDLLRCVNEFVERLRSQRCIWIVRLAIGGQQGGGIAQPATSS